MSNRWVCKSTEEYDLDDIKKIFEGESKGTRKGEHFDILRHVIRLNPEIISTDNSKYLSGTFFYEDEFKRKLFELNDDGELVEYEDKPQKTTHAIDFWISDKGIFLFRNSQRPVKKGKDLLSSLIFRSPDKIKNLNYDIESIEQDVKSGILQGMWTYHFIDRQGNVTSGTLYGENVDSDSMYNQTIGAPKNWIGIEKDLDNEKIKINVYKKGTITILKNYENPTKIATVFEVLEEFSKYAIIT